MNRSSKRLSIIAAGMFSAALVLPATAALADNGDNNNAICNRGEICYTYDGTYTYQKHFWNAGSDANQTFYNVTNGAATTKTVANNTWGVWNRDTACQYIKIVDDRGFYPDNVQSINRDSSWTRLNDAVRNQNDCHERC